MSDDSLIYTEVPSSSISASKALPSLIDIDTIIDIISKDLKSIDSSHVTAFKQGMMTRLNETYNNKLKQYLYNLNLFIEDFIRSSIEKTSRKSLLYTSIFNIINTTYQLIDLIDEEDDTTEIVEKLNSAILGLTINNTKNTYEAYNNKHKQGN